MATLLPFRPISLNPVYARPLLFPVAKGGDSGFQHGDLKGLLEPAEFSANENPDEKEQVYQQILENLHELLVSKCLDRQETPGLYIYEITHKECRQTGVWGLADLNDYRSGVIKIHELTLKSAVTRLKDYRQNTGLEGSPVLLTYLSDQEINRIIAEVKQRKPNVSLGNSRALHLLWKIDQPDELQRLMARFRQLNSVYLADGHHRLESAAQGRYSDSISALYIPLDQLKFEPYHRIVFPGKTTLSSDLLKKLAAHYHIRESNANRPVQPDSPGNLGVYLNGQWYHMREKRNYNQLDALTLHKLILSPVFDIHNPATDKRLKYSGGENALAEVLKIIRTDETAIAFTLAPASSSQFMDCLDKGEILPPKTTWIAPKVPYGLLIYQH